MCAAFGLLSAACPWPQLRLVGSDLARGLALQYCLPSSPLGSTQLLCSPQLGRGGAKRYARSSGAVCPEFVAKE